MNPLHSLACKYLKISTLWIKNTNNHFINVYIIQKKHFIIISRNSQCGVKCFFTNK